MRLRRSAEMLRPLTATMMLPTAGGRRAVLDTGNDCAEAGIDADCPEVGRQILY